jgi:hypothetical protein
LDTQWIPTQNLESCLPNVNDSFDAKSSKLNKVAWPDECDRLGIIPVGGVLRLDFGGILSVDAARVRA